MPALHSALLGEICVLHIEFLLDNVSSLIYCFELLVSQHFVKRYEVRFHHLPETETKIHVVEVNIAEIAAMSDLFSCSCRVLDA